jgi:mutual gliding-motility protein MglA
LSFINFAAREINCKIVYYGAGLGGKTTNLQFIFQKTAEQQKGKMISLATETDRTLFFDFLPLDLGTVRGFKTRIHLYTVPGQVFYDASRKLILRGVDGIVFVADSQEERQDANVEALDNLMSNLKLNKRDLPNALPVDALSRELRKKDEPVVEAVAFQGVGVFETLKEIARQVLQELKQGG